MTINNVQNDIYCFLSDIKSSRGLTEIWSEGLTENHNGFNPCIEYGFVFNSLMKNGAFGNRSNPKKNFKFVP